MNESSDPNAMEDHAPQITADLAEFIPLLVSLRSPRRHITSVPTFIPRNFGEAIQFYDDGTNRRLYAYVNKAWRYCTLT